MDPVESKVTQQSSLISIGSRDSYDDPLNPIDNIDEADDADNNRLKPIVKEKIEIQAPKRQNDDETSSLKSIRSVGFDTSLEKMDNEMTGPISDDSEPSISISKREKKVELDTVRLIGKTFEFYGTPIYDSSADKSSLNGSHEDNHFLRLLNIPLPSTIVRSSSNDGQPVGTLTLMDSVKGTLVVLKVCTNKRFLGTIASFGTLAYVGLRPAIGSNPIDQTVAEMATFCRQSLLIRLILYDEQMIKQLKYQRYPFPMFEDDMKVHLNAIKLPLFYNNNTTNNIQPSTSPSNIATPGPMFSYPRLAFPGQPSTLPNPNERSSNPEQPFKFTSVQNGLSWTNTRSIKSNRMKPKMDDNKL
ncbi:hypothetical protein BLOT_002583 [Blomia tropicalis]|nr:hypothetical protein BLOT_002583 [Blomia tropicalis]